MMVCHPKIRCEVLPPLMWKEDFPDLEYVPLADRHRIEVNMAENDSSEARSETKSPL